MKIPISSDTLRVLTGVAIQLRRAEKRLKLAKAAVEGRKGITRDNYAHYELDRAEAVRDTLRYSLYIAKASIGRRPKIKFSQIPDYGDLMTLSDWIECCNAGGFIDYDGHGDLATIDKCSNITISPSERKLIKFPDWATHVVWYNK